ncbi:Putative regulator of chromosome condensation 1/beta-lactamase-inhibitor protein II [Septoria linicola]|uniref:Regulator of chromosome condensation 1/beta-lactamase-inhibitor protein II n=1 Tax=Septoria linicola TaxID=215465 RepID=A0A9Q9B197_9PEZI|nr:Putative regulator of chromosome condensation 1/beta-lactamase-inhibitor protein II [Septoria linicola]
MASNCEHSNLLPKYKLYAFGSNGSGQLGIGHTEDVSLPEECKGNWVSKCSTIRQLAGGGNHTIAVFTDRAFASVGDNRDGRCMTAQERQIHTTWQQYQFPPDFEMVFLGHVAATWSASFATCEAETPYVSGTGNSGEIGLGPGISTTDGAFQVIEMNPRHEPVVKIVASMGHVVVVLESGEVLGWGRGRKGQLGRPAENMWTPRRFEDILFKVVDAACGKDFTVLFGEPSKGELLVLGLAGSDRFGVKRDAPDSLPGWKQVAASWGSIYVLMESGELKAWGRNDHGQLPPSGLPLLDSIAAGSEHCLGLTRDGKVLAWGWGEHGNCGMPIDKNGDVKGRWNEIATVSQLPASAVFAGCATSFIAVQMPRLAGKPS